MKARKYCAAGALGLVALLAAAACGSSSSSKAASGSGSSSSTSKKTITLGSKSITVGDGPLKIAYFSAGSSNAYLQSANAAAVAAAKKAGVALTLFDGGFSATTQTGQMRQALATGKFNAWAVDSLSPDGCSIVKSAIAKGILISTFNQPTCDVSAVGDAAWIPGTLNFIAGDQTPAAFEALLNKIATDNPGPQHLLLIEGTPGVAQTVFTDQAVAAVKKSDPQLQIVVQTVADYSLAGANKVAAAALTAHPELTLLATNYSDMTEGALTAVKAAGKLGKLKVYDAGGSTQIINSIKAGDVQLTVPFLPATEFADAVTSLVSAWGGTPGPHYVNILDSLQGGQQFLSKANVGTFTPQY